MAKNRQVGGGSMKDFFLPGKAESVGLIINYRCTNRCAHCLYCSAPDVVESIEESRQLQIIEELAGSLPGVLLHVGGGEPLLSFDRVKKVISAAKAEKSIILEYVETNGIPLREDTEEKLLDLRSSGVERLLLSISPFHNEFIPARDVERIFRSIITVLGYDGIFPWHPGYLSFLKRASGEEAMPVDRYFASFTLSEIRYQLSSVIYIHPGGRAAYFLARHFPLYPPVKILNHPCREYLASPVHAHIDYQGNYLTGFCSGLRLGEEAGLSLSSLYGRGVDLSLYPILSLLASGGIRALYDYASGKGYTPDQRGYVSPCHLCLDARVYLYQNGERPPELYPSFFYEELGARMSGHL